MDRPEEQAQEHEAPRPRQRNEAIHIGEYALQILAGLAIAYLFSTYVVTGGPQPTETWAALRETPTEPYYTIAYTSVINGFTHHIIETHLSNPPPPDTNLESLWKSMVWIWNSIVWISLLVLVVFSTPRIAVAAGLQLRRMLPPGGSSLVSRAVHDERLSLVVHAVLLGFVASGLNTVMQRYHHSDNCYQEGVTVGRSYLPMRDREDVKQFLRRWGALLQQYGGLSVSVTKLDGSGVELSNVQYTILSLTLTMFCSWELLTSPCSSLPVFKVIGLTLLMGCESVWMLGKRRDLARGDRLACWQLLWHLSVVAALLWAPM